MTSAGDPVHRGDNIVLVGYRGCGKTVVGRALAVRLNRPFVDTDDRVVELAGHSVREIFASWGEADFRRREHDVIRAVAGGTGAVISVGGGAVLREDNRELLRAAGRCVWLVADEATLIARVSADPRSAATRPSLTSHDLDTELRMLLAERLPYYESVADDRVDTTGLDVEQVVNNVIAAIASERPNQQG